MSTSVLKVNIHCKGCGRKIKQLLKNIPGVKSVTIDVDQGRVTILATVDTHTLKDALEKAGFRAELIEDNSIPILKNNNLQIVAHTKSGQSIDQRMLAQLHQFSEIKDLDNMEITYSRTVRLNFMGQKENPFHNSNNKAVYINGPQTGRSPYINGAEMGSRGQCSGGHVMSHENGCCGGHFSVCSTHNPYGHVMNHGNDYWAPPPCGCSPPPAPLPPWQMDIPSAPPEESQVPNCDPVEFSSPLTYPPYSYVFSDEKINSCKIM